MQKTALRPWTVIILLASGTASADPAPEQQLCDKLVVKYNSFVDIVPLILPVAFPANNDYFVGPAEVIFYGAEDGYATPKCEVIYDQDITMFRADLFMRIVILNQGSRMEISRCKLEAHLRLQKDDTHLFLEPLLVDVQIPGDVFKDGVRLDQKRAEEILRPTLIKGFTSLASQHLSYSGSKSGAVFVDPQLGVALFKQLLMSYVSQLVP